MWSPGGGVRVSWSPALARAEPAHILAADSYKLLLRVGEGELGVVGVSGNVSLLHFYHNHIAPLTATTSSEKFTNQTEHIPAHCRCQESVPT